VTQPSKEKTRPRSLLRVLADEIESCTRCPRLVRHREAVSRIKRRAYADETYWGRGVAGFGDPDATLLVVGLAPGAHGANRTGRAFTGDSSGDFLYAALHRAGLASQPSSIARGDGLVLRGVFITLPVRCVPPDNKPTSAELARCRPFFDREIAALGRVRSVLALGAIAWTALLGARAPRFAHGATAALVLPSRLTPTPVFASYHVSRQNTQTGRLTPEMFDEILRAAMRPASV
jgi:uracil-DNA glycosylase family 4